MRHDAHNPQVSGLTLTPRRDHHRGGRPSPCRSGELRGAIWGKVAIDAATWTVPGARTKTGDKHRVALSRSALEFLEGAWSRSDRSGLIFPSTTGRQLSNNTIRSCSSTSTSRRYRTDSGPASAAGAPTPASPARSPKPHSDTSSPASKAPTNAATSSTDDAPSWTNGPPTS